MWKRRSLIFFMWCISGFTMAQQLSEYRWKNRLVVIVSDNTQATQDQLNILALYPQEIKDRKIKAIQLSVQNGFNQDIVNKWERIFKQYLESGPSETKFLVGVIGLDGGVKLARSSPISAVDLFSLVDNMPMRQAEISRKGR